MLLLGVVVSHGGLAPRQVAGNLSPEVHLWGGLVTLAVLVEEECVASQNQEQLVPRPTYR